MKRLFILLAGMCLSVLLSATARETDSEARDAGTFYVYDAADLPELTPAPEGYSPFYVSHFGRHGARYCTSEYETLFNILKTAEEKGLLSDKGKAFQKRYLAFYDKVKLSRGNLTELGKAQHRGIAERLFWRFPEVFEGPTHIDAVSTESARVIMSMWSLLFTLQGLDADIDISADASSKYGWWLQPSISSNPYLIKDIFRAGPEVEKAAADYFEATVPWRDIAGIFFTDPDALTKDLGTAPERFTSTLYSIVTATYCLDEDRGCFDDVLSSEQVSSIWKTESARYCMGLARYEGSASRAVDYAAFTLGQIIETADKDIADGSIQLRLRFGHDSGIAPLFAILDLNGCGQPASTPEESLDIFPNYLIPMAASLQLVFYKNTEGDILLKALMNEKEATLPLEAVSGPYYSWEQFKVHFVPIVRAAKRSIIWNEPLAVLTSTDWGWTPAGKSGIEVGGGSVNVFGSTQNISMVRFPAGKRSVSVVESDGPKAGVVSKTAKDSKALAAINGSYFDVKPVLPVTFVKDEGKILCSVTSDGGTRCNGMLRIKDRKGKTIDILTVDSLSTLNAAKGWREAIVSGPVLLEDGTPVEYADDGTRSYRRFYSRRHPRSAIGYSADGWVYFIVVDGRFPSQADGMSIDELTVLCEALGLHEALNLDGGGSSTLWTKDAGVLNYPYDNLKFDHEGERVVPNIIIVK